MLNPMKSRFLSGKKLIYTLVVSFILCLSQTTYSQVNWLQSPGPFGGEVRCIAVSPDGYTYFGSNGAGIFRSSDFGSNWSQMNVTNTGFLNLNVRALAFDSSGYIFAAILDKSWAEMPWRANSGRYWRIRTRSYFLSEFDGSSTQSTA